MANINKTSKQWQSCELADTICAKLWPLKEFGENPENIKVSESRARRAFVALPIPEASGTIWKHRDTC